MKILFLSDDFPPRSSGGAGVSTYELAAGMKKAGHDVSVVTTVRDESDEGVEEYRGLKVFKILSNYPERWRAYLGLYNPPTINKLEHILKKIEPDVVHANNIHHFLSYHSLRLAKRYAKTVVITLRDAMSFSFGKLETEKYLKNLDAHLSWVDQLKQAKRRWNPLRNFLIKRYLRCADKIFAVSNALKKALEQNGIRGVEVIHTGIDISEYQISNIKMNKNEVLFPGRLSIAKGMIAVKKAMKIVQKEIPDASLQTINTTVRWFSREEMNKAYSASCIVLVPSVCFDALPRSVLEAMALGKPVIGTSYGGAGEVITNGETGYVVNPFNVKDIANKIIDLLNNSQKSEGFGRAGLERIKNNFNLSDKITEYIRAYERIN